MIDFLLGLAFYHKRNALGEFKLMRTTAVHGYKFLSIQFENGELQRSGRSMITFAKA